MNTGKKTLLPLCGLAVVAGAGAVFSRPRWPA